MTTAITFQSISSLESDPRSTFIYSGDRPDWLIVASQHRDSDALQRSNFRVMQSRLEAIDPDSVTVESASHWAVGYVDYLLIDPASSQLVEAATAMQAALDDYPVLDDRDYSDLEWEENHPGDGYCYDRDCDCGAPNA